MKKEKTIRTYQRRTKSGKMVTVRQHTASYDAADKTKDSSKRKGAGEELEKVKAKKVLQKTDLFDGYDFSEEDFNEWYEGTGSASDKKVAKALRKTLGRKAYGELSDLAADNYKKGGASSFFKKNVHSKDAKKSAKETPTKIAETKESSSKEPAAIARHLSSYQKELDKMQKRKDAGFKYVGVGNNAIPPAGGGLEKVSSRIKYLKEQISLLEKGRKDFRNGKLDSAWKNLREFNGITESSVYGRKYAISKNKQRAAEELESYGRFGGLTGSGTYGKYINGKKVSDAEYETHLKKSGYYKRPRPR